MPNRKIGNEVLKFVNWKIGNEVLKFVKHQKYKRRVLTTSSLKLFTFLIVVVVYIFVDIQVKRVNGEEWPCLPLV